MNSLAHDEHTGETQLAAVRGPIVDRNGEPLALSAETRSVYARPKKVVESSTPAERSKLAAILMMMPISLESKLNKAAPFVWLERRISPDKAQAAEALGIDGIGTISEYKRFYPESNLAASVVGLAGMDGQGLSGLELQYDKLVRGEAVELSFYHDALGHPIFDSPLALKAPEPGAQLELTIDSSIQSLAETELGGGSEVQSGAKRGSAIVLDPFTGEVMAMANVSADGAELHDRLHNPAVRGRVRARLDDEGNSRLDCAGRSRDHDRRTILLRERALHDRSAHDPRSQPSRMARISAGIIEVSSNIGASKIALTLGSERYYEGLRAFGIGSRTGIDLPGEAGGLLSKPSGWKEIDLANHGFGQGVAVTPIQLAVAYAAIANGGNIVRPYVVRAAYDAEGHAILTHTPQVLRRAIAPDIAHQMNLLLRNVVMSDGGTAAKARVDGFIVAGKTGTAQMVNPENGTYFQNRHVSSFVGFLPADDPRLLILVALYDVGHEHFGGLIAAPVFSEIAQGAVRDLNITAPSEAGMIPMPDFGKDSSGESRPQERAADRWTTICRVLTGSKLTRATPNFSGLSLRRAMELARVSRVNVDVHGGGYVVAQEPGAGAPLNHATVKLDAGADRRGQRSRNRGGRERRAGIVFQRRRLGARQAKVKLGELLEGLDVRRIDGDLNVEITGLSYDSRQTWPGHLYFSTARDAKRNRANIEDALNRGARAVVVDGWDGGMARPAATLVESERPRLLMGAAASRFFGAPSERVDLIGITGTSGKTTTSYILASIFEAAGMPAGIIGTIGIFIGGKKIYSGLTTPESIDFESALAQMEREGVRHVAAEVSSIGIAEGRVDALNFRACMFTNLGRDHLDYHKTIEDYFAAKLRLFTEILPRSKRANTVAVVRGDDPFGRRVLDSVKGSKISFGMDRSLDVHPETFDADLRGIRATVSVLGKKIKIESPLLGEINLLNILGASGSVGGPGYRYGCGGG